jgi:hypothetical protein
VNTSPVADPAAASARYEIKMTCDEVYLPEVRSWVRLHPDGYVETYPPRQVNNIYMDTFGADYLADHLSGVGDRQKLRFRWYGRQDTQVQGILELKGKSGHLGWKRQCPIPRTFDLTRISWHDWMGQLRAVVDREPAFGLLDIERPTLLNRYVREYYVTFDGRIRLTVDHELRVYDQTAYPTPNLTLDIPIERHVILEVKSDPAHLRRLSDTLTSFPLRVERNSKYVTGMQSLLYA